MGNNQKHSCESNLVPHPPRKKIYKSIYKSHFSPFRSHSGSFRFIPVSFRSIPVSFRFIPVSFRSHSGSFRFIPVHSGSFRSVPVFSNAQVWGAFAKSVFKPWDRSAIEKTHLQFCKRYLEVHNKASDIACRAELGKFPLIIDINKKILNYLNYLREKEESSIVKQSLKISIDLHYNGHNSFYSSLMKMTDYYNFCDFNCNSLNEGKIKQYVDLMKKKYISYWNQTLQHSQKLSFYYTSKKNYSLSAYLDLTRKNPSRKSLVKLRISSHKLRIETGR